MRTLGVALLLLIALATQAGAAGTEIYINNKPFKGACSGPPTDLMLEAEPYFKLAGGDFQYDPETGTATLDGAAVNVTVQGSKVFVRAKEMVSLVGGRYNANAALGTVDIYAFDPVEAARKAWARVFALPAVTNDTDFQVMATLTRGILTRDLKLDLDFPVELILATQEEIAAAGGPPGVGGLTYHTYRPGGQGIANARIMARKGMNPLHTMHVLASGWGSLFTTRLGLKDPNLVAGFGIWCSHYVFEKLGSDVPPSQFALAQSEAERQEFARLLDLQKTGDAQSVVTAIRNRAPNR